MKYMVSKVEQTMLITIRKHHFSYIISLINVLNKYPQIFGPQNQKLLLETVSTALRVR